MRAAGLNGIPLLGNGGSVDDPTRHDRCAAARGAVGLGWAGLDADAAGLAWLGAGALAGSCGSGAAVHWPSPAYPPTRAPASLPLPACSENNVEQVALGSLPPGPVAITVGGANVFGSAGPQPYALVVHGDFRRALGVGMGLPESERCGWGGSGWLGALLDCLAAALPPPAAPCLLTAPACLPTPFHLSFSQRRADQARRAGQRGGLHHHGGR